MEKGSSVSPVGTATLFHTRRACSCESAASDMWAAPASSISASAKIFSFFKIFRPPPRRVRRRKLFAAAVRVPAGEPLYVQLQIPAVRALNFGAARIQSVRRDVGAVKLLQAAAQLFALPARG